MSGRLASNGFTQLIADADPFLQLRKMEGLPEDVRQQAESLLRQQQQQQGAQMMAPSLDSLMDEADPEQLKYLLTMRAQMPDDVFRQAMMLLPRRDSASGDEEEQTLDSLMRQADPEQLQHLLLHKDQQGMSDDIFFQALKLLPERSALAELVPLPTHSVGLDVLGEPTEVPHGMTAAERSAWERDGMFWRRKVFTREQALVCKEAVRAACTEHVAPLGMISGPGARVFFADDPTAPPCITEIVTAPGVLGPVREIVGDNTDYLYTKAVWKDAEVQTGFGWHWDHAYWGGAPKYSTWVALDDAEIANGCLQLVPGSHKIIPQLRERFCKDFRRQRDEVEDPWLTRSGGPPTKGDDFVILQDALDVFLKEHGLGRETHDAAAGDVLFFSSYTLHSSHRNQIGSADRWALISTYRDASTEDSSRVFLHPRPVLRGACSALGRKAASENPTPKAELTARYILPGSEVHEAAKMILRDGVAVH